MIILLLQKFIRK